MAPKKKNEARARSKSHKKPTPAPTAAAGATLEHIPSLRSPTAATSPPLPSPLAMLPSLPTKKMDPLPPCGFYDLISIPLASSPPLYTTLPLGLRLTLPTQKLDHPFLLSDLRDAGPSSSTGETHQEAGSCSDFGETSLPPPLPPSDDDEPFDDHPKPSVFFWPSGSRVRPDAAEPAELLTTHLFESVEPSTTAPPLPPWAKQPASRKKEVRLPTTGMPSESSDRRPGVVEPLTSHHPPECDESSTTAPPLPPRAKRSASRKQNVRLPTGIKQTVRSLAAKDDFARLIAPAISGLTFASTHYDAKTEGKTLAEKLLVPLGLSIRELAMVVDSL